MNILKRSFILLAALVCSNISYGMEQLPEVCKDIGTQTVEVEKPVCSICTEGASTNDPLKMTVCEHWFHLHCLDQWRQANNSCPECRTKPALLVGKEVQDYLKNGVVSPLSARVVALAVPVATRGFDDEASVEARALYSIRALLVRRQIEFQSGYTTLDFSNKNICDLEGLNQIPGIEQVHTIILDNNYIGPATMLRNFEGLSNLRKVSFVGNHLAVSYYARAQVRSYIRRVANPTVSVFF